MKQIAYLIKCNDNVVAVVLNKEQLSSDELEVLKWQHYQRNKRQFKEDFEKYLERYPWRVTPMPVTEKLTQRGAPHIPRTHVPETFPQPPSAVLPEQTQLKRKQLPAVKKQEVFGCPICENQIGEDHKPGCPEAMPPTT